MPPKKQDQSQSTPYKPCFILPLFMNGPKSNSALALNRPVNVKKNIDIVKIIQILKDKGLEQYIVNGQLSQKGRQFACANIKTVVDQYIVGLSKPADPKKDAKKDAKKQSKKQQPVVQNAIPPIQIQNQKNCNDFFVFLSIPNTPQQIKIILQKDIKIDIVVIIKQKIKPGSRKPNYALLNNQRNIQDLSKTLHQTKIDPNFNNRNQQKNNNKDYKIYTEQIVQKIKQYRSKIPTDNPNKNLIILQIPYLDDISKPQNNQVTFIKTFFERVCKCTKQMQQFTQWKTSRKLKSMIQPIKQKITKQVQVEDKNDKGKKGGKSTQPVFQTVEQIVEKRYQDFPQHIKSDLLAYYNVKNIKKNKISGTTNTNNQLCYRNILYNCLQSLKQDKDNKTQQTSSNNQYGSLIQEIGQKVKQKFQLKPINKMTTQIISHSLRNINYIKDMSMNNSLYFQFPKIDTNFSYMQLAQKSSIKGQKLMMQYILNKLQNLAKKSSPKLEWKFGDRQFVEKLSKEQLVSILNQQILLDPQIFSAHLQTQGVNLLIMSRTNPPGRVLYHNSIFDWKVLPDFQNWTESFLKSKQKLQIQQFFDYQFQSAGNLTVKKKCMMPSDNTVIRNQLYTIGSKKDNILHLLKDNSKFGLTKKKVQQSNYIFTYWHQIQDRYRIRVFKSKINQKQKSNSAQQNQKIQNNDKNYNTFDLSIRNKGKYLVLMDPNPTIFWQNHTTQKLRRIDSLGQITSYRIDGSIHIYSPNGDVSIFRNGKWNRITDNQYQQGNQNRKVQFNQISEGQSIIKIREDQTIIITDSNGNKKIIFPDETCIYEFVKQKKRQIKIPNGPVIRIYFPRDYNLNVIGYGSAFAYLGFTNILERSYDGYLFQFIDQDISSHYYTQKYDKNGKMHTDNVRLITHRDSSIIKINSRQGKIVYVSPNKNQALTEQTLNQRWLQTFTVPVNHGEGVFDIDLMNGHIENKDSETNKFVAKINQRSQALIAVSFITQQEDDSADNFPNGFHIKQQNYFLPPPINRIPPRLFKINQDGSGCEYLSKNQIGGMNTYTVTVQHQNEKIVRQYCRQQKSGDHYVSVTFSQAVNQAIFQLPDVLKKVETKESMIPNKFNEIRHRAIQQIEWNSNYQNINKLQKLLKQESQDKIRRKQQRKLPKLQQKIFGS